jgi:hypothetical protein
MLPEQSISAKNSGGLTIQQTTMIVRGTLDDDRLIYDYAKLLAQQLPSRTSLVGMKIMRLPNATPASPKFQTELSYLLQWYNLPTAMADGR